LQELQAQPDQIEYAPPLDHRYLNSGSNTLYWKPPAAHPILDRLGASTSAAGGAAGGAAGVDYDVVVPLLQTLVSIKGGVTPASNITFSGIIFRDSAPTFLSQYTAAGPGDWSIFTGGAFLLENAKWCAIDGCLFDSLGGNGVYMKGMNTAHTITGNEFANTGDSAIAAAGNANFADATSSDFPYGNRIEGNHFHGLGVYGKQSSAYFQTLSCRNSLVGNVMYDGPRAAINFNDGILISYVECIDILECVDIGIAQMKYPEGVSGR
jgi:hypothetical protein